MSHLLHWLFTTFTMPISLWYAQEARHLLTSMLNAGISVHLWHRLLTTFTIPISMWFMQKRATRSPSRLKFGCLAHLSHRLFTTSTIPASVVHAEASHALTLRVERRSLGATLAPPYYILLFTFA